MWDACRLHSASETLMCTWMAFLSPLSMLTAWFEALLELARWDVLCLNEGRSPGCLILFFMFVEYLHVVELCVVTLVQYSKAMLPWTTRLCGKKNCLLLQPLDWMLCFVHVIHQYVTESDGAFFLVISKQQGVSYIWVGCKSPHASCYGNDL